MGDRAQFIWIWQPYVRINESEHTPKPDRDQFEDRGYCMEAIYNGSEQYFHIFS